MAQKSVLRLAIAPILLSLLAAAEPPMIMKSSKSVSSLTFRVCDKIPESHASVQFLEHYSLQDQIKDLPQFIGNNATEILQMSDVLLPSPPAPTKTVLVSRNGFIKTVVDAYSNHYNLVIRPDDVWAAIVTQFSFYVNKHAEKFRGKFVNFEGKKKLVVNLLGSLRTAPYDEFVKQMSKEIDKNLVDPAVKKWILPDFSTTTENDIVTVGVIFMATMKKYFEYEAALACGIPSVTLEGTVEDWQLVYQRLEKLKEYELGKWHGMLEPVLKQILNARQGNADLDFWQKIVNKQGGGSGVSYISGWITVFAVFDKDGNWIHSDEHEGWPRIDIKDIPTGIVEVDVTIDDNGKKYNSVMLAGHLAEEIKGSKDDTVQPTLGWLIALKP